MSLAGVEGLVGKFLGVILKPSAVCNFWRVDTSNNCSLLIFRWKCKKNTVSTTHNIILMIDTELAKGLIYVLDNQSKFEGCKRHFV